MRTKLLFQVGPDLRPVAIALVEKLLEADGVDVLRTSDPAVSVHRASTAEELAAILSGEAGFWIEPRKS